jgi:hypothetical protein
MRAFIVPEAANFGSFGVTAERVALMDESFLFPLILLLLAPALRGE